MMSEPNEQDEYERWEDEQWEEMEWMDADEG